MLRIIYSPAGARDGTGRLFKEALLLNGNTGSDYSGIVYLAPSQLKIRSARDLFHTIIKDTYIPPLFATPSQLSKRFCQAHGESLLLPSYLRVPVLYRLLNLKGIKAGMQYSALLSDLIVELKSQFPGLAPEALSEGILDPAIDELGISPEIAKRLETALEIVGLYNSTLSEKNFLDEADSFFAAWDQTDPLRDRIIILDDFFELTPAERGFILHILSGAKEALALVPVDEKYPQVTEDYIQFLKGFEHEESGFQTEEKKLPAYYAYSSREEELESIARKIKAASLSKDTSVLAGSFVLFPPGTEYFNMAERVFSKYGIPCSLPSDTGIQTARTGDLEALLDIAIDGRAKDFARVITSSRFKDIPEELARWGPKITPQGILECHIDDLPSLPEAPKNELKWLKRKISGLKRVSHAKGPSYSKVAAAFLECLRGLGFESERIAEELEERVKGLSFLDLIPGAAGSSSQDEIFETLRYVIGSLKEEDERLGVRILPFSQASAFLEADSLYFAGLVDGRVPARPELDFFTPERLRARLGLRTMKSQLLIDEFLFKRLVSSAKNIHLSYPEMEGDKVYIPSIFISEGQVLKNPLYGIFSKEEELLRKSRPGPAAIEEIKIKYTPKKVLRVTDIDRYRECPRIFFLENVLGLAPLELKEYEPEPKTAGTLFHSVMEKLCPVLEDDIGPLNERAVKIFDEVLSQSGIYLEPFWKEVLKENFLSALPEILEIEREFREKGYKFHQAEQVLEGSLNGIKLKGKIDRIDIHPEGGCQILDYKTGRITLNGNDVLEKGATLQLFLYAALAAREGKLQINQGLSRVGLYSLKELKVKFIPGRLDKKKNRNLEDYITSSLNYLARTVESLREGDFTARPLSDLKCRRCAEKPYCPYSHAEMENGNENGN